MHHYNRKIASHYGYASFEVQSYCVSGGDALSEDPSPAVLSVYREGMPLSEDPSPMLL